MGLFTIKGKEVLQQAEVVVYDRLVGPGILRLIPEEAKCVDVGKRAGNHTIPQERINRLLLAEAQEGKRVVRLKGGDPFLFGRGGEELELLAANHIPFEVVPGVTSAIAVPAYNGIPVTHRDCTSSLHIITGHKKKGAPCDMDFEALVRTKGTLVFLMGTASLPEICQGLLSGGMDPGQPAALLMQGTSAGQRKIVATVSTLEAAAAANQVSTPAMIVVGKVCGYGNEFSWYERLPLFGNKIIVTRPKERSGALSGKLRELGAEVLELPAIRAAALDTELEDLSSYDYLAFTSPAGVNIFFDRLREQRRDVRSIRQAKLAAIGPGTAAELEKHGLFADLMPEIYDGIHLGILLGESCREGERILIPRAREGNPELVAEILKRRHVEIVDLPIYETCYTDWQQEDGEGALVDQKALIEAGEISMALFTSASTVKGFAACTKGLDYGLVRAVCIGRQTKAAADALGMETYMVEKATIESLTEAAVAVAQRDRIG